MSGAALLLTRLRGMYNHESEEYGLSFKCRPTDIFITTYPKCGTTWVSFICHCLRTRGDTDFDEITQVVPWTVLAKACKQDLYAEQKANPRLFKSHESYDRIPKNGKYIYCARDPIDVGPSFYEFTLAFAQMTPADVSLEDFFDEIFAGKGTSSGRIWEHFLSFYQERTNPSVLWIFYEDLLDSKGFDATVNRIAEFMGIFLDPDLLAIVHDKCSFSSMKKMETKFNDNFVFDHVKLGMGLPLDSEVKSSKVARGGGRAELSAELKRRLEVEWKKVIASETALDSYNDMRKVLSTVPSM